MEYSSHIKKRAKDMMLMLGLNEIIHQLSMEKSAYLYGHVLGKDGCIDDIR